MDKGFINESRLMCHSVIITTNDSESMIHWSKKYKIHELKLFIFSNFSVLDEWE